MFSKSKEPFIFLKYLKDLSQYYKTKILGRGGYKYSWSLRPATSYLLSWTCVQLWHTLTKHMTKYKPMTTTTSHDQLNYLDMMTEKSEANATATLPAVYQQQVHHGRSSVNRPPTSALIVHHHHHQPVQPPLNQQPSLHHNRSSSSLSVTDYREPVTTPTAIALESGGGAVGVVGRQPAVNGSVSNLICARPAHQPHAIVYHPRPTYRLPLNTPPVLWHQTHPHFPTAAITFQPLMDLSPSSRHTIWGKLNVH
ncbi:hypothetical protein QTP88_006783 [Uroleucon formosanum]